MLSLSTYKNELNLLLGMILVGQLLFALLAPGFTTPQYEGRIYSTTGVKHKQEDLHKLNEAAHYFGQTIIGWLKFPNFMQGLGEVVDLPAGSLIFAHIQERQNIIFVVQSPSRIERSALIAVKDHIQSRIDEYNSVSQTEFVLTNLDYELVELKKSYAFGAIIALLASLVISFALIFIKREFMRV